MMHIDYAREVVEYHEDNFDDHNLTILKSLAPEGEVMRVAESFGDQKIIDICSTMRESQKSKYKKITDKQRHAIAAFLLEKLGTARAVLASAFGTTEAEMFGASDVEVDGVKIHPTLRVAYGLLSDFVADAKKQEGGVTYPASRAAVRATKQGRGGTLTVLLPIGITAVTQDEAKKLGLEEHEAEWYQQRVTAQDVGAVAGALRRELDE